MANHLTAGCVIGHRWSRKIVDTLTHCIWICKRAQRARVFFFNRLNAMLNPKLPKKSEGTRLLNHSGNRVADPFTSCCSSRISKWWIFMDCYWMSSTMISFTFRGAVITGNRRDWPKQCEIVWITQLFIIIYASGRSPQFYSHQPHPYQLAGLASHWLLYVSSTSLASEPKKKENIWLNKYK